MPTVLVTGANRGIGLEYVRQYAGDGWRVHAACRTPDEAADLAALDGDIAIHALDVADLDSIGALARSLSDEAVDVLINNAGVYGHNQALGGIDYDIWTHVLRVNVLGPIAMAERFLPNLRRGAGRRAVFMTSRMGSIADNGSGGSYIYRSSKAALNAAARSFAIDTKADGIVALVLHPGWVKTDMGGAGAKLTVADSVRSLRRVIASATAARSGAFFNYDGQPIPW